MTCTPPRGPPVRFHNTQVSGAEQGSPFSAAARTPSTFSRIHCSFAAEKQLPAAGLPAADQVSTTVSIQRRRDAVGAGIPPYNRVVVGPPIHQRRLTLVGNPLTRQYLSAIGCGVITDQHHGALPDSAGLAPPKWPQDLLVPELVEATRHRIEDHSGWLVAPWSMAVKSGGLGQLLS